MPDDVDYGDADVRSPDFQDIVLKYLESFRLSNEEFIKKEDKFLKNQDVLIKNQENLLKKEDAIIDLLGKNKNVDYGEIDKILANNVKDLKTNSKELIDVNNKLYDKSDVGFHSFYYLGSVIIGFFIGYVVINTFLQLAFDD